MSDDYDLEWNDDAFGGDIDFDDDFDMDPYKNKGFFAAAGTGFLDGVVDQTVGSADAVIRTARSFLPTSFSNFLDRAAYINDKRQELIREFKESNYESVKSLQSIAKNIASRIDNENSTIAKKLTDFSEVDFSDWEKLSSGDGNDVPSLEELSQEVIDDELTKLVSAQNQAFQNVAEGMNQMQAHVGGGMIAAIKGGNRELIGVQSSIRELLDYQRNVQYKMDQAKVELLARTYLVNAKYYKFMETALHTSIKELKKITDNTGKSDFEKTSLYNETKAQVRRGALGAVGKRVGGLLGELRGSLGKDGRQDGYNFFESLLGNVDDALSMADGVEFSRGMAGDLVGRMLADKFVSELPYLFNQGPFAKLFDNFFAGNPELKGKFDRGWSKVKNAGNIASYNANNGLGLLNYYSQYWKDFDEYQYEDYDDYVEQMKEQGKEPMPRAAFTVFNGLGNQAKGFVNRYMGRVTSSRGTQYTLSQRDATSLTQVSQWREINNITLNDVIPGWLSRIYESMEKFRTGNDDFVAPVFSYNRGQFVDKNTAKQIVENDVFNHSSFQNAAINARNIVNTIDVKGNLTEEQRQQLALRIIQDADKEFGFNPYYYTGEIEGFDPELQGAVNNLIRTRFGINDEKLAEYDNADMISKLKMAGLGFEGDEAETLNTLGSLVNGLKNSIPNIGNSFALNRQAGNEQTLRDLGLIFTRDGTDRMNMDVFWNRLAEYLKDPYNPQLRGDYEVSGEVNAGSSRGFGYGSDMPPTPGSVPPPPPPSTPPAPSSAPQDGMAGESMKAFNETVEKFTKTVSSLNENLGKVDFSKVEVDLGTIPDGISSLQSVLEKINDRDEKQYGLIEQMTSCVCRQAGGWGSKSDEEKKRIERDEKQGKKSIMDRLKSINPRGMFNKAVETLIDNQPLVLGGIIGGIGTLALHDPKAAALLTGGIAIAGLYGRLKNISRGEAPNDDEDIYDETGTIILHAAKLRAGDYYDVASKKVIRAWKDIKGAVLDLVTKTYTTVAQLTGKIFGPDGRALIIRGLDKVRDALNTAWNKIDLVNNIGKAWDKGKEMFYQQDVYVKGDKEPRLTRSGFMNGKYYCYDLTSKQPFQIKGWNEIKGPVYELDSEGNLSQVISEAEIAQGLVTSSGMALDKLGKLTSWVGNSTLSGLLKAKDYTLEKAGILKDKAAELLTDDYSGIESRLDRIYYLLCDQFGIPPSDLPVGDGTPPPTPGPSSNEDPIEDIIKGATGTSGVKDKFNKESHYPNKVRLNSLEDQEIKEEKKKRDDFYEDIHAIRENMDGAGSGDGKDKEKKGLFGKLGSLLAGGAGMLKKLFTNPLGFAASLTGMVFKSMIKSPLRLISIGNLLFKGALGVASPIYKLMTWGFSGLMWGIRKLIWRESTESFGDWFGGRRRKGKSRRRSGGRKGKFGIKLPGRLGSIAKLAAVSTAGLMAYNQFSDGDEGATSQRIADQNESSYDKFFDDGDSSPQMPDNDDDNGSFAGDLAETAAWTAGPWAAGKLSGKAYEQYNKYRMNKAVGDAFRNSEEATRAARAARAGTEVAEAAGGAARIGGKGLGSLGAKGLAKVAAKGGSRAIPILGELLMALDGVMGFADGEAASNIFHTNYVTGNMRAANGLTDALDLGGLVSGTMNTIADWTGIDALRQEGGMTRLVEKSLSMLSKIPVLGAPFKLLDMMTSDLSSPQRKIRLAMYGIDGTDNELAKSIEAIEQTLEPHVLFNGKEAWLDDKAPIKELISSIVKLNPNDTAAWFKLRFEPVFKVWQSAIRIGGYETMFDFDSAKAPKVLKISNQVRGAITALRPYPLDVVIPIDPKVPIMNRVRAEGMLVKYFDELKNEYGKDVDADGNIKIDNHIRSDKEYREGESEDTGFFARARNYIQKSAVALDDSMFPSPAKVMEIDISDLHKDEKTEVDELTLVRLAAYGNDEDNPIRIDAVLRLERYCEKFFVYQGGYAKWDGKIGEIYSLFKNTFRSVGYWQDNWVKWFNDRFLPITKVWFEEVYKLRNTTPANGWKSLTATNKLGVASALLDVKTVVDGKADSAWNVTESPFPGFKSGTDPEVVKRYMTNLESKATEARLKTPDDELKKSQPVNLQDNANERMDPEKERQIMEKLNGGVYTRDNSVSGTPPNTMDNNSSTQPGGGYGMGGGGASDPTGQFSGESAGDIAGTGDDNFTPNATVTDKGFKISEKEAIKTIINEFVKQGITDNRVLAFALANAKAETGFQGSSEDLNYQASVLKSNFREFIRQPHLADKYGKIPGVQKANPVMIGKIGYGTGSKAKELGNKSPEDGWMFRGRGFTQITGRGMYDQIGKLVGDNFTDNPEKVTKDPVTAAKTEVGFFKLRPEIMKYVKNGDIERAAKRVGTEPDGVTRKKQFYPEFLKRLTEGDLKGILTNSEKSQETKEEGAADVPVSEIPPDAKVDVAPVPPVPTSNPNDTVQQAADKVNAPPQDGSGTDNVTLATPNVTAPEPAPTVTPDTVASEPASVPTPAPVAPPPVEPQPAPVPRNAVDKNAPPAQPQTVTLPEGTIEVRDSAVVSAIAGLAEAISRTLGSQGPNTRRVGLGPRS